MNTQHLVDQISALPPTAQRQIADFIELLQLRYQSTKRERKATIRLVDEPFIGMWKDREDQKDSTQWVRDLRNKEWR
ncbi:DUF2281 domain-containing protein [Thiofilum flexile]|uniref:DUF2281 domain-containing protein n=1 Tax=Thiofilum flexile TaxID=125627 RepID=UPI00036822B4|nr:DUF2281 domain-containing protein [Thiofilum flexile]